jgi:hypothetical protein
MSTRPRLAADAGIVAVHASVPLGAPQTSTAPLLLELLVPPPLLDEDEGAAPPLPEEEELAVEPPAPLLEDPAEVDPEPPSIEVCAAHATTARELATASAARPEQKARRGEWGTSRSKIMACRSVYGCIAQPLIDNRAGDRPVAREHCHGNPVLRIHVSTDLRHVPIRPRSVLISAWRFGDPGKTRYL